MSILIRINNYKNNFTKSEKLLESYIMEHLNSIPTLSTNEMAQRANTSPASVVRFVKKIGYDGFNDFKMDVAKFIGMNQQQETNEIYEAISVNDQTPDVIQKVALNNINAIQETIRIIDEKSINEAIKCIKKATRVHLYGVGESALVATDLLYKLVRINISASMYMDTHTQLSSASIVKPGEVAIGISHSGNSMETFKALEMVKSNGGKTISITKFGKNPISNLCDINLFVSNIETGLRVGAISSRIAQLTLIDILYIGLVKDDFDSSFENIKASRLAVKDFKYNS